MQKLFWTLCLGFMLGLHANASLPSGTPEDKTTPSPRLISAKPVSTVNYDAFLAGLQAKIEASDASAQEWLQKLWAWVCYVLHDVLQDPRVVEFVKIEYQTTTANGDPIPVSGLAILPQRYFLHQSVPMLAFQHPTQVERRYSPSLFNLTNMWSDAQFNVPFGAIFAMSGFAVAMADYPGMGQNTNAHPYCTVSLANSVVDMARAVREYLLSHSNTYATWDGRMFLTGYSEGGYATMVAARDMQEQYSNEFKVAGVAGLDGPYSLSVTMRNVMLTADATFNSPYFLPYTINGYDAVYAAHDPVFSFTNAVKTSVPTEPEFAAKLRHMCMAGTNTGGEINALIYKATPYVGPRSILSDNYIAALADTNSTVCRILRSNDAYLAWTPQMKMRLFHYPKDDLVPYGNATNAFNAFQQRHAPHVTLESFGTQWPLNQFIEWLKTKMGSYHAAVAPIAYVKSLIWLHTLACDLNEIYYTPHDFDGDRLSDPALFCEASGNWQMLLSNQPRSWRLTNNLAIKSEPIQFTLGGPGAVPVLRDFDGDRLADAGVFHAASGIWTVQLSMFDQAQLSFPLGNAQCLPTAQDYDGDRLSDPSVYNRQTGEWQIFLIPSLKFLSTQFGGADFSPIFGDFDGDGKADPSVYRSADGLWNIRLSSFNYNIGSLPFGGQDWQPVPADYDGDRKTDPCIYREATGDWQALLSGSGYKQVEFNIGGPGWLPAIGDYDGDHKADIMLYHANSSAWLGWMSKTGYKQVSGQFGSAGCLPVRQ